MKWTSDIVIRCIALLYQRKGHWAHVAHERVSSWFVPLRGTTVVIISTMIMLACYEQSKGAKAVPTTPASDGRAYIYPSVIEIWCRLTSRLSSFIPLR